MRKLMAVALCGLVAGCASSSSTGSAIGPSSAVTTQTMSGTGAPVAVTTVVDAASTRAAVNAPMDVAWTRLQAAYDSLGIKIAELNQQSRTVGNPNFKARRKIGNVQLRTALNCGGESSAPNSESYELTLSIQSKLTPAAQGVVLETYISGNGRNPLTNSGNYVPCYSMGVLEMRIAQLMHATK